MHKKKIFKPIIKIIVAFFVIVIVAAVGLLIYLMLASPSNPPGDLTPEDTKAAFLYNSLIVQYAS